MKTFGKRWSVGAEATKQRATATGQQLGLFEVKDLVPASGWQVPPFLEWCEVDMMPVTPPDEGLRRDLGVLFHAAHTPNLAIRDYLKKRQVEKRLYRYWGQAIPRTPPELGVPTPRKPRSPKPAAGQRRTVRVQPGKASLKNGAGVPARPAPRAKSTVAPAGIPGAPVALHGIVPPPGGVAPQTSKPGVPNRGMTQVKEALRGSFAASQKQTRFEPVEQKAPPAGPPEKGSAPRKSIAAPPMNLKAKKNREALTLTSRSNR